MKNKFNHKILLFICLVGIFAIIPCFAVFATCANECSYTGQKEFAQGSIHRDLERICGNYDSDDCLEWSAWKYGAGEAACGDGTCNTAVGENNSNCPGDCGHPMIYDCFNCGDGSCNASCGENSYTCAKDCSDSDYSTTLFSVANTGKNSTKGDSTWVKNVSAYPNDVIQLRITITNTGNKTIKNIIVRDNLPNNLSYWGGLNIDGTANGGSITSGLNIGDIYVGQTNTIIFDTKISPTESFGYGITSLNNSVTVNGDGCSQINDSATVEVNKGQVLGTVTEIATGVDSWVLAIYPSAAIAILLTLLYMLNGYLISRSKVWRKIMDKVSLFRFYILSK